MKSNKATHCRAFAYGATVLVALITGIADAAAEGPQLKALIIDGQANPAHDWKATSPVLKKILESTGLFTVDRETSPPGGESLGSFKPDFSEYDVLVLNYDGASWPDETREAFVEYVVSGGGVLVYHAANNAFPDWDEYNEITGLGGWGGRNEKSGPMIRLRDGEFVRDHSPGPGGSHGLQHEFPVTVREPVHPIMRGLPATWLNGRDELYSKLRGPAKNLTILATAYADRSTGGTGEHEPILFTVHYGKGRIFHTPLGHGPANMRCVAFTVTLQRGAEWAATGDVTQTELPDDFPTPDKASYRPGAPFPPVTKKGAIGKKAQ